MAQSTIFYVRVTATVVHVLGLLLTTWRIYFRLKIGRFWWEDAWAAVLLFAGLIWVITYWIYISSSGLTTIVTSWIYSIGYTCVKTIARMSILFSIIRIIHGRPRLLKFTYACVASFALCWTIIIVQKVVQCVSDPSWHRQGGTPTQPFCRVNASISIFQFITDCVAASILVVLPLHMLWKVKLRRRQKRMILSIFASSVVLVFGALPHMVGQILNIFFVMTIGMHIEIAVSIIVCNLLVVVTYTYQFLFRDTRGSDVTTRSRENSTYDDDDDFTRPMPQSTETGFRLTSVDLEVSLSASSQGTSAKSGST